MTQPYWLSECLNLSHRTLPIIHTFWLKKSDNFKLRFSSFSHQKEKLRSEEVTSIPLILGGKSNISVEGWWEMACFRCETLRSTGFKGTTSNESKSWKNCEKSQEVRVWPWPLLKVGENWRLFRVQPRSEPLAQTFLRVILGLIQTTHHHPESAVQCVQWCVPSGSANAAFDSLYILFRLRECVSRRIFPLAPPHALSPLTTHLVYPEQWDEIRSKKAVCQPFIVLFRAF